MDNIFESEDGFLNNENIIGKVSRPTRENGIDFKPWHKPRKQLVRDKQWWFHLDRMLTEYPQYNTLESIKYFGLPGGDMLDVHFLVKKFASNYTNKKLLVHGFIDNQADKDRAEVRMSQLCDLENFHKQSKVERYNFSSLSSSNSVAMQKVRESSGYHFINLDFCDSVLNERTLDALVHMLHEQFKNLTNIPWLLCLTTRADRNVIAEGLFEILSNAYETEIVRDTDLVTALENYLSSLMDSCRDKKFSEMNDETLSQIMQVCFIYWVINRAHSCHSRASLVSAISYKVLPSNNFQDMYSYVFRFEKPDFIPPDRLGLFTQSSPQAHPINGDVIAQDKTSSIHKFSQTWNVDEELSRDSSQFTTYKEQIKHLLKECGWDVSTYDDFAIGA